MAWPHLAASTAWLTKAKAPMAARGSFHASASAVRQQRVCRRGRLAGDSDRVHRPNRRKTEYSA